MFSAEKPCKKVQKVALLRASLAFVWVVFSLLLVVLGMLSNVVK